MSTTIESLELEIQSKSQGAISGIDALTSSLEKLKRATSGGVGLTAVAKQLTAVNTATKGLSPSAVSNLNGLTRAIETLSGLGGIKISSSIPNNITRIKDAIMGLNGVDIGGFATKIGQLTTALKPLSEMPKQNISSTLTQLKRIPEILKNLSNVDMGAFAAKIKEVTAALQPLAAEMQKVSAGFSAFPAKIQKLVQSTNNLAHANDTVADSYSNLAARASMIYVVLSRVATVIGTAIDKINRHIESVNLFTVAMGQYAAEAKRYAEEVGALMGINPGEWMYNQGIFMTLATGFGMLSDRAYTLSTQLTQLGYDISSFFNISVEDAMQKLQSGISGELEPLRRLGYDLSQARLQAVATSLGIDKLVSSMTQAEKAELRYYAIMMQVTSAQGDMARTLQSPANQLRILKSQVELCAQAFGSIFIPILNAVLPVAIAVAKVIRFLLETIAALFGFAMPDVDFGGIGSGLDGIGESANNATDGMENAKDMAKDLKNYMLGFDELNVIQPPEEEEEPENSGGGGGLGGSGFDFELPTYDFLDAIRDKVDAITQELMEWLGLSEDIDSWSELLDTRFGAILKTVLAIGVAFAAWKIAHGVIAFFDKLTSLMGGIGTGLSALGLLTFAADLSEFMRYFEDFVDNGATFENVAGMLTEFAGMIGDAVVLLGNVKLGGALKVVQGIGEIIIAIKDIDQNNVNWDNVLTAIRGLSNVTIGLGFLTGEIKMAGWGVALQGLTTAIRELTTNWEAIKQGDWSGVDKVALIISALEILGGLAVALDVFSKIKELKSAGKAAKKAQELATATEALDTTTSSTLSPKLSSLAKNLGLGVVIIAEVAAAAAIFVGAIAGIGYELQAVADAWQPVIGNCETVAVAIGIGAGLLTAVGLAAYALGTGGKTVAVNIGIGTAILLELGVATALFIAEIWGIGKGLNEIGEAWQPVIDNGETIAIGIGVGTGLLVAIGVVTAALGAATVASAGSLPLAIGLGTAILVELAIAFVLFTESLVDVADELTYNLAPALERLNEKLPGLTTNMSNFVDFMTEFAKEVVRYSEASVIASLSATIDSIIGLFAQDPVDKLAKDVEKIDKQTKTLNEKLEIAIPELEKAVTLLSDYRSFLTELEALTNCNVELSTGMFVNMKEVGEKLVTGFVDGIQSKSSDFTKAADDLVKGFNEGLKKASETSLTEMSNWGSSLKERFSQSVSHSAFHTIGIDAGSGFTQGFESSISSGWTDVSTLIINNLDKLKQLLSKSWMEVKTDTVKKWSEIENELFVKWKEIRDEALEKFSEIKEKIYEKWVEIKLDALNEWVSIKTTLVTKWSEIKSEATTSFNGLSSSLSSIWVGIKNNICGIIDQIISKISGMVSYINSAIQSIKDSLAELENSESGSIGITDIIGAYKGEQIDLYANGGFPTVGEMFIAREAGAEMVGSIGHRTAVANNDQIVEGIANGVAAANGEQNYLLREQNALLRAILEKETGVNIDGKEVTKAVEKYQRERGRVIMVGGV